MERLLVRLPNPLGDAVMATPTLRALRRGLPGAHISVLGLPPVPGEPVRCQIVKPDGTTIDFEATHTFSDEQVEWFKAGSALNVVRRKVAEASAS